MTDALVLLRLRRFLLAISALLFSGTVVELLLVGHTEGFVQLIPFILCGLGLLLVLAVWLYPRRLTMLALRACLGLVLVGSLFGVYEHVLGNIAFLREIHPNAQAGEVLMGAISGGNPLLAPGMLVVAALLAIASTYQHTALGKGSNQSKP